MVNLLSAFWANIHATLKGGYVKYSHINKRGFWEYSVMDYEDDSVLYSTKNSVYKH